MATKRFTTNLTINAQDSYTCNISKNYTEVFNINQELSANDAFIQIVSGSATKSIGTMASAQAILIKNTGNIAAEILVVTQDWKNSSSVDVVNSVDVGGGGAVTDRSMSMLLPAGEFIYLPNSRMVSYSSSDADPYESAANAGVGDIEILPSAINSGNEYRAVAEITGTTYGGGTAELIAEDVAIAETDITVDDGDWFKAQDLIMVGSEVMEVESVSGDTLTVKRGLLGSTDAAHSDNAPLLYFFGNEYLAFDSGKCMTDKAGRFKQRGAYFGYARTGGDQSVDGLVAGSVAIQIGYTEGGFLDWGLSGITGNQDTGLTASTTYTFHLICDEYNAGGIDSVSSETAIAFTTDSADLTWNSSGNAVIPKIQAAIDTQTKTTGSGLLNKSITISIHDGDIRVKSNSNNSDTRIGIANVSGTTPFGVGRFPALSSSVPDLLGTPHGGGTTDTICFGPPATMPQETITDPVTGIAKLNESVFLFDDGQGNLRHNGNIVGKIDYEKGHCHWTTPAFPEAEFKIWGQSHSAHSGGVRYYSNQYNSIREIKARSVNPRKDATVQAIVLG